MEKVLAESTDLAKYKFPEQDFLQEYYPDWVQLPWWFNGLKTLVSNHLNVWDEDKHRVIHYIKDKPWDVPPHTEKYFAHPYLRLNQWWWNAYYNDGDWRANGLERHALQQAQYAMALEE
ncbi:hypothetical protein HK097_011564 [Rhizophlyctis rosea]|uniref:Uncharacterized protein n=1 Tax=Rhizophlyctis rosea TaxID=64517 RepID=A0AAD5SIB5_9FUNG|nr:hypothetical protein HK097_011564 [Rhizophlyctis rosea]